jgi:hypothetical protein
VSSTVSRATRLMIFRLTSRILDESEPGRCCGTRSPTPVELMSGHYLGNTFLRALMAHLCSQPRLPPRFRSGGHTVGEARKGPSKLIRTRIHYAVFGTGHVGTVWLPSGLFLECHPFYSNPSESSPSSLGHPFLGSKLRPVPYLGHTIFVLSHIRYFDTMSD